MMNKKEQFAIIYRDRKDKIYRLCLGFTGNHVDADDLFQEILLKVWQNLAAFRNESSINTWIYRIATNTALQFVGRRNKKRNLHVPVDLQHLPAESSATGNVVQEQVEHLYKAVSELREMDRLIIGLLLDGNSYKEIAEITGFSVSNIGVRINRSKKILKKKLGASWKTNSMICKTCGNQNR